MKTRGLASDLNLLMVNEQTQNTDMPTFKPLPDEGSRKLCLLNGEWIVLEVGCESPTYEENFTPFRYWFEPFFEILSLEVYDVSTWVDLPEIPTEEIDDEKHK